MNRDNLLYIILGFVAVILIGITIGLQLVIMVNRNSSSRTNLDPETAQSLSARVVEALQQSASLSTSTVAPTAMPLPPTPVPPTATPVPPTATPLPPTPIPTMTATLEPPTPTVQTPANLNLSGEQRLLGAENLTISSDDALVLEIVKNNTSAVGFVGRAYYHSERDTVRALSIQLDDGRVVSPSPDTVFDGTYPISRMLYVYSTVDILHSKPEVAAFLGCYLSRINEEILEIGFFPLREAIFNQTLKTYNSIMGAAPSTTIPLCNVARNGTIDIAGSTTVAPITERIADHFVSQGYAGTISVHAIGTGAGFTRFCTDGAEDMINADRQITASELENCRAVGREPIAFAIGEDALSVIVSADNTFVDAVTIPQLQRIFTDARYWSDVNPAWPQELINRVTPSQNGGTFATFVARVFDHEVEQVSAPIIIVQAPPTPTSEPPLPTPLSVPAEAEPTQAAQTPTVAAATLQSVNAQPPEAAAAQPTAQPTSPPASLPASPPASTNAPAIVLGVVARDFNCPAVSEMMGQILQEDLAVSVEQRRFDTAEALFDELADGSVDVTFCYVDPDDRTLMRARLGKIRQIGIQYYVANGMKLQTWANGLSKATLRSDMPCVYDFLEKVSFMDTNLPNQPLQDWRQQYANQITTWLTCPYGQ